MNTSQGLFGKLPQLGDFMQHRLPQDWTDRWHSWLRLCLTVSQEQLGEQWHNYFLNQPVWRFAISPGAIHPSGAIGVMMPSVDQIGRYFPLTLVALGPVQPWAAFKDCPDWFSQAEQVVLAALDDATSLQLLTERSDALVNPLLQSEAILPNDHMASKPENGVQLSLPALGEGSGAWAGLAELTQAYWPHYSLWWSEGSSLVPPAVLTCNGLPQNGQFAAFLDGAWQRWGWCTAQSLPEVSRCA